MEIAMSVKRFAMSFGCSTVGALVLTGFLSSLVYGQEGQAARIAAHRHGSSDALVKIIRESTERFRDVSAAEAEGYQLMFGCVSGPDSGAMGLHYVNLALVGDG